MPLRRSPATVQVSSTAIAVPTVMVPTGLCAVMRTMLWHRYTLRVHTSLCVGLVLLTGLGLALSVSLVFHHTALIPYAHAETMAMAPSSALAAGIEAYEKGFMQEAIPLFEQAVAAQPSDPTTHLWLARALQKQGGAENTARAIQAFRQVLQLDPQNVEALTTLGEVLTWDMATRQEGVAMLKRAFELNPSKPEAAKALVQVMIWEQRFEEALPYAQQVHPMLAQDKAWLKQYALILTQTHHYPEALQIYENQLNVRDTHDLSVLENYALILWYAGRKQEAQALYGSLMGQVNRLTGTMKGVHLLALSGLAYAMNDYASSYETDRMVIGMYPKLNHPNVQLRMARSLTHMGRYPEAMAIYQALYQRGELESYAKLEYAMLLLDMKIPEAEWPESNLVRKLYQEVASQPVTNTGVLMSLARLADAVGEPFQVSWRYYEQAMDMSQNDPSMIHEAANFLKSQGNHPELNLAPYFQALLQRCPNDVEIQLALAEYLSWNEATRDESIKMMAGILASHPDQQAEIERLVAENVQWLQPSASMIPYLRTLEGYYPNNPHIKMVLAKSYLQPGGNADMGFQMLQQLHEQYPTDESMTKAYIEALMSTKGLHRKAALRYLGALVESCPSDYELKMKYAQMLIYDRQYPRAIALVDEVLAQNPADPRAISLRGYAMLWSGRKFEARDFLEDARSTVPNQPLLLVTLARVYREIGRFDKAMILLEEVHRLRPVQPPGVVVHQEGIPIRQETPQNAPDTPNMDGMQPALDQSTLPTTLRNTSSIQKQPSQALLQALAHSHSMSDVSLVPTGIDRTDWQLASYEREKPVYRNTYTRVVSQPPAAGAALSSKQGRVKPTGTTPVASKTLVTLTLQPNRAVGNPSYAATVRPALASGTTQATSKQLQQLVHHTDSLENNLEMLDALQVQTKRDIQKLSRRVEGLSVGHEDAMHLNSQHSIAEEVHAQNMTSRLSIAVQESTAVTEPLALTMYDDAPVSDMDVMVAEEVERLSQEMNLSMRPTLRAGYVYSKQEGGNAPATIGDVSDRTFNMRTSGVQSQLSFSMTPRLRLRGGVSPRRIYLPDRNLDPRSTWSYQYALGYTYKKSDKWTWDGDLAFTNFTQPGNVNVTGQQTFNYDFNDTWHTNFGFRRTAVDSSLLSFAGQRGRTLGNVWNDQVVGQARDNTVFLGLNATPNRFWDMGLGYEFGWITGHEMPTNFRNQVNGTVGFTLPILDTHSMRLGANTSWMGYTKDSTVGFYQLMGVPGSGSPVSDPILGTGVPVGTRFGGYFSPQSFFTIGGRADLAGSFFKKRIEYKLGGGIGFQGAASRLDNVENTNVFTANAQGLLMWNITEWLGLYGNAEYQMAGDLYNRFRWGAGAVIRPNWRAVTPVIKP